MERPVPKFRDGPYGPRYHPASRFCDRAARLPEEVVSLNLAVKVTVHETGDAYEADIGLSGRGSGVMLAVAEAGPASTYPGSLVTCKTVSRLRQCR